MLRADERSRTTHAQDAAFALLRLQETKLIVPRDDIRVLELAVDMQNDAPPPGGVGWVAVGLQRIPVYCLSPDLEWTAAIPRDRPICAVLGTGSDAFGLLCSEASLLNREAVSLHAVPMAMAAPDAPFGGLAIHDDTIACVTSAAALLAARTRYGAAAQGAG
jgi:hypothetical protein